jgi:hypothetical protein
MANGRRDYLLAFLIGTVVGVGATFLLSQPERKRHTLHPLDRQVRRFRRRGRRMRRLVPGRR